jgi:uncharacterized protein YegJ (DUF2314 family)
MLASRALMPALACPIMMRKHFARALALASLATAVLAQEAPPPLVENASAALVEAQTADSPAPGEVPAPPSGLVIVPTEPAPPSEGFRRSPKAGIPSLTLLFAEPEPLSVEILEDILRSEFGAKPSAQPNSRAFAQERDGKFLVAIENRFIGVASVAEPYFPNTEAFVGNMPAGAKREAILRHQAFVDLVMLNASPSDVPLDNYQILGKLAAGLAGEKCLGVFSEQMRDVAPARPGWEAQLRGASPLDIFFERAIGTPPSWMRGAADSASAGVDDPLLQNAIRNARRTFPHFIQSFQNRAPEASYLAKVPVASLAGEKEFLWAEVLSIGPLTLIAQVTEDPVLGGAIHRGDNLEVPLAEVQDWMIVHPGAGGVEGAFTAKAFETAKSADSNAPASPSAEKTPAEK